jgi:hypothetical protein
VSDAGRWRRFTCRWWLDGRRLELNECEQLVYVYLKTGPLTNAIGLYRMVPAAAAADFPRWTVAKCRRHFDRVRSAFTWEYDAATALLYLPEWMQENAPQSPNVVKSWRAQFAELPDCQLKAKAAEVVAGFLKSYSDAFLKNFGEVTPEGFRFSSSNQETETETKTIQDLPSSPKANDARKHHHGWQPQNGNITDQRRHGVPNAEETRARQAAMREQAR